MKTTLCVALLGANGKAGSILLSSLIENGFRVHALVRNRQSLMIEESDALRVHVGDATNEETLLTALRDCDIIVNAISNRGNAAPISSRVTEIILKYLSTNEDTRYFVITGKTVKAERDAFSMGTILQRRILSLLYPGIVKGKQDEYRMLKASDAQWTLIRCPLLTDDDASGYEVSGSRCGGRSLPKKGLAAFILAEIKNREYARKSPFVYNAD